MSTPAQSPTSATSASSLSSTSSSSSPPRKIRWGILGCGKISHDFVNAIRHLPDMEVVACGARSGASAADFATQFNIPRSYGSYAELVADGEVDVVYVATLHPQHAAHATLALEAGKHCLVEKPFAMTERDAARVFALARLRNLFVMEAMWTRFQPAHVRMRELIAEGVIGDVKLVQASFGVHMPLNVPRLWTNAQGGGAMLDLGVYTTALAANIFSQGGTQEPTRISAVADLSVAEKIDMQMSYTLQYGVGRMAVCTVSMLTNAPNDAYILGTKGWIRIAAPFNAAEQLTYQAEGQSQPTVLDFTHHPTAEQAKDGFKFHSSQLMVHECIEVNNCVRAGKLQSDLHSHNDTLHIARIMDECRRQCGVVYAEDRIMV